MSNNEGNITADGSTNADIEGFIAALAEGADAACEGDVFVLNYVFTSKNGDSDLRTVGLALRYSGGVACLVEPDIESRLVDQGCPERQANEAASQVAGVMQAFQTNGMQLDEPAQRLGFEIGEPMPVDGDSPEHILAKTWAWIYELDSLELPHSLISAG